MEEKRDEKGVVIGWEGEINAPDDWIQWARENYLKSGISKREAEQIIKFVKDKESTEFQQQLVVLMFELLDKIDKAGVSPEDRKKAEDSYLTLFNEMKEAYPLQYGLFEGRYEKKKAQLIKAPSASASVSINNASTIGQALITVITGWVPGAANLFQGDNAKLGPRLRSTITSASNLFNNLIGSKLPIVSIATSHDSIKSAFSLLQQKHDEMVKNIESGTAVPKVLDDFRAQLNTFKKQLDKSNLTKEEKESLGYTRQIETWLTESHRIDVSFFPKVALKELSALHKSITSKSNKEGLSTQLDEFTKKFASLRKLLEDPDSKIDKNVKEEYSSKLNKMQTEVLKVADSMVAERKGEASNKVTAEQNTSKTVRQEQSSFTPSTALRPSRRSH